MKKVVLLLFSICIIAQSFGQWVNADDQHIAIDGYDPVSYHEPNGPIKGTEAHTVVYKKVNYFFATPENKARFVSNPNDFLPAYGGWCAFAMAKGQKVDVNPLSYSLEKGRVYLFYKSFLNDTRSKWLQNHAILKEKADHQWSKLITSH